jgi:hypothetical protein
MLVLSPPIALVYGDGPTRANYSMPLEQLVITLRHPVMVWVAYNRTAFGGAEATVELSSFQRYREVPGAWCRVLFKCSHPSQPPAQVRTQTLRLVAAT